MANIRETLTLQDRFTSVFTKYISNAQKAATNTDKATNATKKLGNTSQNVNGLNSSVANLVRSMASLYAVQKLLNFSDTYSSTTARIQNMTGSLEATEQVQNAIYDAAVRSRGAYTTMAASVAKLGTLAKDAFSDTNEVVKFAETLNKAFVVGGSSATEMEAATYQLTQAMAAGRLQGDEFTSIMENAPMLAQAIATEMGVAVGELKEMSSQGTITSEIIKNALFNAADDIDARFQEMPITWAQVWSMAGNIAIKAFEPLLGAISQMAQWTYDNLEGIIPVLYAVGAGALFFAVATGIATGAVQAFFATLLTNPLFWIAIAIAAVVYGFIQLAQAVGGFHVLWMITTHALQTAWGAVVLFFYSGVVAVMGMFNSFGAGILSFANGVANTMGSMRATVLVVLQDMINQAIQMINSLISAANGVPGVAIPLIAEVTFGTAAAVNEIAAREARNAELEGNIQEGDAWIAELESGLKAFETNLAAESAARQAEIASAQDAALSGGGAGASAGGIPLGLESSLGDISGQLGDIGGGVGSIDKAVNMSEEDLKSLVDMAERQYVNNINLTAQTPVINVTGANTGNTAADRQNLANSIRDILVEQTASASIRTTARAF